MTFFDWAMERAIPEPNSGCWLWVKCVNADGYGRVNDGTGKVINAHRRAYRDSVGPLQKGKVVMHTCDVPCCINPDHLRQATQIDNIADRTIKGRSARHGTETAEHAASISRGKKGKRHSPAHCEALSKIGRAAVREIYLDKRSSLVIARERGISKSSVLRIRSGKINRHLTADLRSDRHL